MIILYIVSGLIIGEFLNWAADYLPRFSAGSKTSARDHRPVPTWTWRALQQASRTSMLYPRELVLRFGVLLLSGLTLGLLGWQYGPSGHLFLYGSSYTFLMLITLIDLKHRLILNIMVYPAIVTIAVLSDDKFSLIVGGALAFSVFFLTSWLRPGDVGAGDVKLAALFGLAFGFPNVLWALLIGIGLGGVVSMAMLLTHRGGLKSRIPYAPFLCLGAWIALFYNPFQGLG
jgi:prepilin signal peptidase PulO-like enzyme (type II secretory pathway)